MPGPAEQLWGEDANATGQREEQRSSPPSLRPQLSMTLRWSLDSYQEVTLPF